jgi:endonuclease YncB( thermonuclease family)
LIPPAATESGLALAAKDCSGYDAWEWAQSVYETDPVSFAGLDPDGNGVACDGLSNGFAPAFWTASLPEDAVTGAVAFVVDGDTYEIEVDGQTDRYRLYHADTPELQNPVQCGGSAATDFVQYVLAFNDTPGQVWVESVGQLDKYGRHLAYIWITVADEPYLLNHLLINNGWAEDIDSGDAFDPYKTQLHTAALFAQEHRLGVWAKCGGFGIALPDPTPVPTQPPLPTDAPFVAPTQAQMGLGSGCVPSYSPCVPSGYSDLNCSEIGFRVYVSGADPYGLDRDNDGIGCESY